MLSTGATFAELTKGTFKKIMIMKPVVNQYQLAVAPMYQQIESLLKKNQNLK